MSAVVNGFVYINVTVSDLQIETTVGISADPCFILNGGALAAKIG